MSFIKRFIINLGPAALAAVTVFTGIKWPTLWPPLVAVSGIGFFFFGWAYGYREEHQRFLQTHARLRNCQAQLRATAGEILQGPIYYNSSWQVDNDAT